MGAVLESVNVGQAHPNPDKHDLRTGIDKHPVAGPVTVRDPGPKTTGLGSGLVGDYIGDVRHHGGSEQAIYAFQREDLDAWEQRLGRSLRDGYFGENFTTRGLEVNEARLGERWRVGATVEVVVCSPRIPCATFRGHVDERGWLKRFTAVARPGAYLQIRTPGSVQAGDAIEVVHRPAHEITVSLAYRALRGAPELLPRLLEAGDDLVDELRDYVTART
jgi:MOSC domain-containing protein YiiM